MKKILKFVSLTILSLIILITVVGIVFVNFSKEFGANPSDKKVAKYAQESNFNSADKKFENLIPTSMDMSFKSMMGSLSEFIKGNPNGRPSEELSLVKKIPCKWLKTRIKLGYSGLVILHFYYR